VELGSGQALAKYHQPGTLLLQVYTVKYEKDVARPAGKVKWCCRDFLFR
jgi:hypothetical protein